MGASSEFPTAWNSVYPSLSAYPFPVPSRPFPKVPMQCHRSSLSLISAKSLYNVVPSPTSRNASFQGFETRGILNSFCSTFALCWADADSHTLGPWAPLQHDWSHQS